MQLDIRFRGLASSEALEARIRERAAQLERLEPNLLHCRVLVEQPHRHHHQGDLFHVRVQLTWGGGTAVVDREPHGDHSHEDPYVAVRDAFDAARRRLEDRQRRIRGVVKAHLEPLHGAIVSLGADGGQIEMPDGRLVPFSRDRVANGHFDGLGEGEIVCFEALEGEIVSVRPLGRV